MKIEDVEDLAAPQEETMKTIKIPPKYADLIINPADGTIFTDLMALSPEVRAALTIDGSKTIELGLSIASLDVIGAMPLKGDALLTPMAIMSLKVIRELSEKKISSFYTGGAFVVKEEHEEVLREIVERQFSNITGTEGEVINITEFCKGLNSQNIEDLAKLLLSDELFKKIIPGDSEE